MLKFLGVRKHEAPNRFTINMTQPVLPRFTVSRDRRGLHISGEYIDGRFKTRTVRVLLYKFIMKQDRAVRSGPVSYVAVTPLLQKQSPPNNSFTLSHSSKTQIRQRLRAATRKTKKVGAGRANRKQNMIRLSTTCDTAYLLQI